MSIQNGLEYEGTLLKCFLAYIILYMERTEARKRRRNQSGVIGKQGGLFLASNMDHHNYHKHICVAFIIRATVGSYIFKGRPVIASLSSHALIQPKSFYTEQLI